MIRQLKWECSQSYQFSDCLCLCLCLCLLVFLTESGWNPNLVGGLVGGEKAGLAPRRLMDCLLPPPQAVLWQSQEWFTGFINIVAMTTMNQGSTILVFWWKNNHCFNFVPQRVQDIRAHSSSGNIVVENLNYARWTKSGSTNTWAESKNEWPALFETETNKRLILSSAPSSTAPFLSQREDWLENHVLPPARKGARRKPPTPNLFISAFWRFLGGSALARWWVLVLFQRERDNWLRPCFREATLHQDCWRVELFQRETLHFQDGWRPGGWDGQVDAAGQR